MGATHVLGLGAEASRLFHLSLIPRLLTEAKVCPGRSHGGTCKTTRVVALARVGADAKADLFGATG